VKEPNDLADVRERFEGLGRALSPTTHMAIAASPPDDAATGTTGPA
jgi:hypothetical protein